MKLWQTYPSYIKTGDCLLPSVWFVIHIISCWGERKVISKATDLKGNLILFFCITVIFHFEWAADVSTFGHGIKHVQTPTCNLRQLYLLYISPIHLFLKKTKHQVCFPSVSITNPWLLGLIKCACKFQSDSGTPLTFAGVWALLTGSKPQQVQRDPVLVKGAWDCSSYSVWRQS